MRCVQLETIFYETQPLSGCPVQPFHVEEQKFIVDFISKLP